MSTLRFVVAFAVAVAVAFPLSAQQRQVGGVGLTVFIDNNYRGNAVTFRDDVPDLGSVNLFHLVSSVQVAPGEMWEICEERNYGGACLVVSGSESDLNRRGWNDRIGSARRVRSGGRRGGGVFPTPAPPPTVVRGIELYSNVRFYGERQTFSSAVSNLDRLGFNDRAMSLTIPAGDVWDVCIDANYKGCRQVSSSVSDLAQIGLARNISSFRPIRQGRGGRGGGGGGNLEPRIVLYDNRGFSGTSRTLTGDAPAILGFNNRAESVRVMGGTWQICDGTRYSGRCVTVSGDMNDLGPINFANRVQSVRLVGR